MNTTEIRSAMVSLAESMGRPFFDGGVVRDVVYAFKSGRYHHLKERVLIEINLLRPVEPAPEMKPVPKRKPKRVRVVKQIKVEGKLDNDVLNHGTMTKYNCGCRCELCEKWGD